MDGLAENQLFLSAAGYLTEVQLTQGAGVMLADSFVQSDDEVSMLGAALGGRGGYLSGDGGRVDPAAPVFEVTTGTVDSNDHIVNKEDHAGGVEVGEYTAPIEATITNDGGTTTVTDTLIVDTIIGVDVAPTGGADGVINATEYDGGVTLTGSVTCGDIVVVTIDGTDYTAVVTGTTWALDVSTHVITAGD